MPIIEVMIEVAIKNNTNLSGKEGIKEREREREREREKKKGKGKGKGDRESE